MIPPPSPPPPKLQLADSSTALHNLTLALLNASRDAVGLPVTISLQGAMYPLGETVFDNETVASEVSTRCETTRAHQRKRCTRAKVAAPLRPSPPRLP